MSRRRWVLRPESSVTSPARTSLPWAGRPEVANSSPAASATTGTITAQDDGRENDRGRGKRPARSEPERATAPPHGGPGRERTGGDDTAERHRRPLGA